MTHGIVRSLLRAIGATLVVACWIGSAHATKETQSEAKKDGYPAKNCLYCRTQKLPKQDTFKPEELNDRGKFLVKDMEDRKAKTPDVGKLKDFPGGKE